MGWPFGKTVYRNGVSCAELSESLFGKYGVPANTPLDLIFSIVFSARAAAPKVNTIVNTRVKTNNFRRSFIFPLPRDFSYFAWGKNDVFQDSHMGIQMKMLKHHPNFRPNRC